MKTIPIDAILPLLKHEGAASIYDERAHGRNALRDEIRAVIDKGGAHMANSQARNWLCGLKNV